jgi:hypothetical protein
MPAHHSAQGSLQPEPASRTRQRKQLEQQQQSGLRIRYQKAQTRLFAAHSQVGCLQRWQKSGWPPRTPAAVQGILTRQPSLGPTIPRPLPHLGRLLLQPVLHVWGQALPQVGAVTPLLLRASQAHLDLACRRSTAQHSTAQHSTAQHSTAQHSTAQHSTGQHSTGQDSTGQHRTGQDSTGHKKADLVSPGSAGSVSCMHTGSTADCTAYALSQPMQQIQLAPF